MGRGYDSKYYRWHLDSHRLWETYVAKEIIERYKITSMIDFGCGIGSILEGALDCGLTHIAGLEINYEVAKDYMPYRIVPYIFSKDITDPVNMGKFDCSWSFEAAEHIKPEGTEGFIANLTNAERFIILTAAPPGQAGRHHINCRPKDFWIDNISEKGFEYLQEDIEKTVKIWDGWRTKIPVYIRKNLMIFRRS